jgi:hypothetical protein
MSILETVSGQMVDVLDLDNQQVKFEDIAWALSRAPRFSGHSTNKVVYSVAQHSTFVGRLAVEHWQNNHIDQALDGDEKDRLTHFAQAHAHLHDVSEGLLTDIPTPIKRLPQLAGYRQLEEYVQDALMRQFLPDFENLSPAAQAAIIHNTRKCDLIALRYEAYHLMASRGAHWSSWEYDHDVKNLQPWTDVRKVVPMAGMDAYQEFVDTWNEINSKLSVLHGKAISDQGSYG